MPVRNKLPHPVLAPIRTAQNRPIMPIVKPPTEPRLSESDVQAFADGMLDPTRAASVETYLKSRPDEAHRVAFYGRLNWQMQNTFHEPDDEEEGTQAPAPKPVRRMSIRGLRALLVATTAALALAAAAIFTFDISDSALDNASMMALEQAVAAQDMVSNDKNPVLSPNGLGDLAADSVRNVPNAIIAQTLAAVGGNDPGTCRYSSARSCLRRRNRARG